MNAVQFLNKEGMTYLLKVTKISKKDWSLKRKKVKSKVEGRIISLTSTELIFQKSGNQATILSDIFIL